MLTQAEAQARVARGASVMDRIYPDWYREIDPKMLDMGNGAHCIVGQTLGHFGEHFSPDQRPQKVCGVTIDPIECGFTLHMGKSLNRDWSLLQETWLVEIASRLRDERDAPVQTWTMRERTGEFVR
jgi:hypothetical protein